VDLAEVAGHVLDQLETDLEVVRDLSPAPTAGDPVLLERLVQNLVENAIRHNLPAEGWLSVRTETRAGEALLTVANTGPAVASYEVPVLFEPFRRLGRERVAGAERGFGLGLSIVRAIALAHGGQVTATPRPEGGLTLVVTLSV
jgi:signal transduction histidine kinase